MISKHGSDELLDLTETESIKIWADDNLINAGTGTGVEIQGLLPGDTVAIAKTNSNIINSALSGGSKDLIIPLNTGSAPVDNNGTEMTGYWATYWRINIQNDTVLTFDGGLMQKEEVINDPLESDHRQAVRSDYPNITLNQPKISQGEFWRTDLPGTHSVFAIYGSNNTGNSIINGGIISGGGSNCFQGGRNNTVFNGTIFSRAREHLVYSSGGNGDGTNSDSSANDSAHFANGLHFNDCIMEYPGIVNEPVSHEANHLQFRKFNNITMTNCHAYGVSQQALTQIGIIFTDIDGFLATNCVFDDYRQYAYRTDSRDVTYGNDFNIHFIGGSMQGDTWYKDDESTNKKLRLAYDIDELTTMKDMTFYTPKTCMGWTRFENCIFDFETSGIPFECDALSKLEFDNCTFNLSTSSTTVAMTVASGAVAPIFTGVTSRVCPIDEHSVDWGPIPGDCGAVITGLIEGELLANATNNTEVLQAAFNGGLGTLNLTIPAGHYYTDFTVYAKEGLTLTFEGELEQIYPTTAEDIYFGDPGSNTSMFGIFEADVTLHNPKLNMGYVQRCESVATKSGTHSTITVYGRGNNLTVNGGIIEGGSSNNFQGGRSNNVFNGTTFKNSREHLIYGSGRNGLLGETYVGDPDFYSDGLTFNDCIFENPGVGNDRWESNHVQLRAYKNVEFNDCILRGKVENGEYQLAFLMSDIQGCNINRTTISDYYGGICWVGPEYSFSEDVNFTDCSMYAASGSWAARVGSGTGTVTFNNCDIHHPSRWDPMQNRRTTVYNNCTLDLAYQPFRNNSGADTTFNNSTWDLSDSPVEMSTVYTEEGSTVFTGTTVRLCPTDGHTVNWGIVPGQCGTVITGLQAGSTLAVGNHNTDVLHSFMTANSNTIIPAGEWYTGKTVYPQEGSIVTWAIGAKLHQVQSEPLNGGTMPDGSKNTHCFRILYPNITLYNPCITQEGILGYQFGTHACLAIYGDNATGTRVYGGTLEYGASNGFQGGESDTIFDGTTFINPTEHCVYVHGGRRDSPSDPDLRPSGITFVNCIMQDPGNGTADDVEANHVQLRSFYNVTLDNCTLSGHSRSIDSDGGSNPYISQWGILCTGVDGLTVKNCNISDFSNGLLYTGNGYNYDMGGVLEMVDCVTAPYGDYRRRLHYGNQDAPVYFTRTSFYTGGDMRYGIDYFNSCSFQMTSVPLEQVYSSSGTYTNCTFDMSIATTTTAMTVASGSSATFIGTTTRICPADGHTINWGPIPGICT